MTDVLLALASLNRPLKRLVQVAIDVALIVLCFGAAMALRLEGLAFLDRGTVWWALAPVIPVTILAFVRLGLYRAVIRYITGHALKAVAVGAFLSGSVLALSAIAMGLPVPKSVPAIYALLLFAVVGSVRFVARNLLLDRKRRGRKPLLIYGAGEAGRQLVNALRQGPDYEPIAFVDDDVAMHGAQVAGLKVLAPAAVPRVVQTTQVRTILLAMPSTPRARRREIIEALKPLQIEVKTIPGMADIVSGRTTFNDLRTVSPVDLLGRDPIAPDDRLMDANIRGKVVMVTGAAGSIGSELCRQIVDRGPTALILFDAAETPLYHIEHELRDSLAQRGLEGPPISAVLGSVQNTGRVRAVLERFGVQTIFHAAAYKHVPLVEQNVVEGIRNNVFGTRVMAQAATAAGVERFILISTDKAVRPTNIMGASKRMAELICQAQALAGAKTVFSMVRFGNVLGSNGSVIPRFRAQIEAGGPVTVTHRDITRYFMTIPEAAQLVVQAGAMARGGDVFILDMGEAVKILDLARSMIRLHGLEPYIIEEGAAQPPDGDMGIKITGLRPGEKLYEELLIDQTAEGTSHPRILTAREASMEPAALDALLDRVMAACVDFDLPAIQALFLEAPLAYQPETPVISDLTWLAARRRAPAPARTAPMETPPVDAPKPAPDPRILH